MSWNYIVGDHLGSTTVVTDASGSTGTEERDSFDAWGKRRNPDATDDPTCSIASVTTRGYTGHEMLDSMCLINMNGRVYDPTLARFLSADDRIPDPYDLRSYNPYAYVNHNPLNTIDPSGHYIEQGPTIWGYRDACENGCGGYGLGAGGGYGNLGGDYIRDKCTAAPYL
jgi:RHS repeat-associated protein